MGRKLLKFVLFCAALFAVVFSQCIPIIVTSLVFWFTNSFWYWAPASSILVGLTLAVACYFLFLFFVGFKFFEKLDGYLYR